MKTPFTLNSQLSTLNLFVITALLCLCLSTNAQPSESIRRNQVGYYPQQEKVIVVEGLNPGNKLRVTTPDGKTLKPKTKVRKAVSPLSQKTRYVITLDELSAPGDYRVSLGSESCVLHVSERPYRDIATASLRLFYLIRSGVQPPLGPSRHASARPQLSRLAAAPCRHRHQLALRLVRRRRL